MRSFVKRTRVEVDTLFVLKSINPAELDKQYTMKEFIEVANREFLSGFNVENISQDFFGNKKKKNNELKTKLENIGLIKDHIPKIDTICISENLNFKICLSPTNNGDIKCVNELKNVWCWHCKHSLPPKIYPLSLPIKWLPKIERFEGEGVFCSFNCMVSYSREYQNIRFRESGGLICLLYNKIFDKTIRLNQITPAPNWRLLNSFGGPMSIDEFRKTFQTVEFRDNCIGQFAANINHDTIPMITKSNIFVIDGELS
jgi:hypothetical protein